MSLLSLFNKKPTFEDHLLSLPTYSPSDFLADLEMALRIYFDAHHEEKFGSRWVNIKHIEALTDMVIDCALEEYKDIKKIAGDDITSNIRSAFSEFQKSIISMENTELDFCSYYMSVPNICIEFPGSCYAVRTNDDDMPRLCSQKLQETGYLQKINEQGLHILTNVTRNPLEDLLNALRFMDGYFQSLRDTSVRDFSVLEM